MVLDRDFDSAPRERKLVTGVESVELNFLKPNPDGPGVEYSSEWEDVQELPVGVEIIITLANDQSYRLLLEVGAGNG